MPYYLCPRCGNRSGFQQSKQEWSTWYDASEQRYFNTVENKDVIYCSTCTNVVMDKIFTAEEVSRRRKLQAAFGGLGILIVAFGVIQHLVVDSQSSLPWPPSLESISNGAGYIVKNISEYDSSPNPNFLVIVPPSEITGDCSSGVQACQFYQYVSRFKCKSVKIRVNFTNSKSGVSESVEYVDTDGTDGLQRGPDKSYADDASKIIEVDAKKSAYDGTAVNSISCVN